jgi:hypothetical protein
MRELERAPLDGIVRTYNFATGTPSYIAKASRKFTFRETIHLSPCELVHPIQALVPPNRYVIFVGHGTINDILALQALDCQFPDSM